MAGPEETLASALDLLYRDYSPGAIETVRRSLRVLLEAGTSLQEVDGAFKPIRRFATDLLKTDSRGTQALIALANEFKPPPEKVKWEEDVRIVGTHSFTERLQAADNSFQLVGIREAVHVLRRDGVIVRNIHAIELHYYVDPEDERTVIPTRKYSLQVPLSLGDDRPVRGTKAKQFKLAAYKPINALLDTQPNDELPKGEYRFIFAGKREANFRTLGLWRVGESPSRNIPIALEFDNPEELIHRLQEYLDEIAAACREHVRADSGLSSPRGRR